MDEKESQKGFNKSDTIDFFLVEAGEHLQTINEELLSLEKSKDDLSLVDKIFREVHAIKGSAGMLGFSVVSQFAHKIEDLLAKLRDHKLDLSEIIIDFLFQSVDTLSHQLENISDGQKEDESILVMFDDLYTESLISSGLSKDQVPSQKKAPSPPPVEAPFVEVELSEISLAELYIRENLFDKAEAIYRKILHNDPSNKMIRQMLEETIALQAYIKGENHSL